MAGYRALKSVQCRFWELVAEGVTPTVAGPMVGVSERCGQDWFRHFGGVKHQFRAQKGTRRRRLSTAGRGGIWLARAAPTIMREINNNGRCREAAGRYRALHRFGANRGGWDARSGYRAHLAQQRSEERAGGAQAGQRNRFPGVRELVEEMLLNKYSPEQIAGVLALTYPDRPEMRVSHETIYKALYVQGRGELRRELHRCLRTGRTVRKPRRRSGQPRGRIPGMVNISERPAQAADRAVPGHWEGDLIIR